MDNTTSTRPTERHPPRRAGCGRSLHKDVHSHRRGITLIEVTVAAVLMSALVVLLGQAVGWVAVARREAELRQIAVLEASNVLERVTALPFDAIDAGRARESGLSDEARQLLGDDAVSIDVLAIEGESAAKRIIVSMQYQDAKVPRGTVRMTAWVYDRGDR